MKTKNVLGCFVALLSLCVWAGCSSDMEPFDNPLGDGYSFENENKSDIQESIHVNAGAANTPVRLSNSEEKLLNEGNVFNLQLLAEAAAKAGEKENVLISPLSLQMALGMLANGLSEAAFEEMTSVMYHKNLTREELNTYFSSLYEPLSNNPDGSICRLANSLWVQSGFAIRPAFMTTLKDCCNARVSYVDFVTAPQEAKAYMNDWASEMTDGLISELSLPVNDRTRAVLLNATLLRTAWTTPFDVMNDKSRFTCAGGRESDVTMMKTCLQDAEKCEHFTRVHKSYGNGRFIMTLSLPDEGYSVKEIIPHLLDDGHWLDVNVDVRLPKFECRTCNDFIPMMKNLGIHRLFDDLDALSGINDQLTIGEILQDAYINVHEKGTEAAAVTEIDITFVSYPDPEDNKRDTIQLYFDRPFVYTISEASTGVLLFAGCVNTL